MHIFRRGGGGLIPIIPYIKSGVITTKGGYVLGMCQIIYEGLFPIK